MLRTLGLSFLFALFVLLADVLAASHYSVLGSTFTSAISGALLTV